MKKLISLILVLVVVGIAVADINPARRLARPLVNLPQESVDHSGLLGPWARVLMRFFAPSYEPVAPRYSAPPVIIPIPPVCTVACLRMPVQAIAQ